VIPGLEVSHLLAARRKWRRALLAHCEADGHWEGALASSALSTAVAITALACMDRETHSDAIGKGAHWLAKHVNADGGWGDTTRSFSNLSTTFLCWAALRFSKVSLPSDALAGAETWLKRELGNLTPERVAAAILKRYAEDRTFSVPILMMLAVCGCLGPPETAWKHVMRLPFELAALPRKFYSTVRLPVVSYALPALIAIGQVIHHHRGAGNPVTAVLRRTAKAPTLRILEQIQPKNGGFLEATPLTGFVTISLASMEQRTSPVAIKAVGFLQNSQRPDGSWPIDTHLATWVSTLAANGLLHFENAIDWEEAEQSALRRWLLAQQYRKTHPYTDAAPGGWAWTPLPGGVPDADDTSGAILALARLDDGSQEVRDAASKGLHWLAGLQNGDGGLPTFCKGWGALPFDQSCADISAHAIQAVGSWAKKDLTHPSWIQMAERAFNYLVKTQAPEGFWNPLWFGNQHHPHQKNPVYGTARVLFALAESKALLPSGTLVERVLEQGADWLANLQNDDGAWGGAEGCPPTIEETAVATSALASLETYPDAVHRGLCWLAQRTPEETAAPIGFYFANLWYYEKLYPLVWTVQAFEVAKARGFLIQE